MFKRVSLFLLVNFGVMLMLMIIANLLGLRSYLTPYGIDYQQLAIFSLFWGMGGSIISLLISKKMAKWTMKVQMIDPNRASGYELELYKTVERLAQMAGIEKTPEVGIYESPEVNAFATGATKNRSMVAVSTGLLNRLNTKEVEGVLGHEVAHIANGDMVTMTLIQGVLNAFVIFFAKAISRAVAQFMKSDEDESPSFMLTFAIEIVLQIVFGMIAAVIVNSFSRWREYRADRGGAELAGSKNMIAALEKLKNSVELIDDRQQAMAALKISGSSKWLALLSSHPPLEERIARLKSMQIA